MNPMTDILSRLLPDDGVDSPQASMLVSFRQPPTPQADAIKRWFNKDPSRQRLRIVVDGRTAGILQRQQVATPGSPMRGFADSSGYSLPGGAQLDIIALTCSLPDCHERMWTTWYDPGDPPSCPLHPGSPCVEVP